MQKKIEDKRGIKIMKKFKKSVSIILTLVMVFTLIPTLPLISNHGNKISAEEFNDGDTVTNPWEDELVNGDGDIVTDFYEVEEESRTTPNIDDEMISVNINGVDYYIGTPVGNFTGFICLGIVDDSRVAFAWAGNDVVSSSTATIVIRQGKEDVLDLGIKNFGVSIRLAEISSLSAGTYTIVFTGTGEFTNQIEEVPLIISGEVEASTQVSFEEGSELLKNIEFADTTSWTEYADNGAVFSNNGGGSLSVVVPEVTGGDYWAHQLVQNGISLEEGKWYVAKYTVTSDVDKTFQLMIQSDGAKRWRLERLC